MHLDTYQKFHFIGIGGMGMRALANILIHMGVNVSGSDVVDSTILHKFREQGATIYLGHKAENIENADVVVISSAISPENPELQEAKNRNIPIFHRSDVLAAMFMWGKGIAVAGAHGKSTTSAMVGQIFKYANVDPTIVLGGATDYLKGNSCYGKGEYVIAEADESDGTFLKFSPFLSIITNIEDDHLDYYGTFENIKKAFIEFIERISDENGVAVVCIDNAGIRSILSQVKKKVITYGFNMEADYQAVNKRYEKNLLLFDVLHKGHILGTIQLHLPGEHNVLNALAAIVTALYCGISFEFIQEALSLFCGVHRRFETKAFHHGIWIVDDYAHHPTEIEATLKAAKEISGYRVICAFQPHRYSRTKLLCDEFAVAFDMADILYFTDIYAASEKPLSGVDGKLIPLLVQKNNLSKEVHYVCTLENLVESLYHIARPGDMIITMGAGNIYTVGQKLAQLLDEEGIYNDN